MWTKSRDKWWLQYRVKVRSDLPRPGKRKRGDDDESLSTVIGNIVHRVFECPDILEISREKRQPLLEAMAHNMVASSELASNIDEDEVASRVDSQSCNEIVKDVEEIIKKVQGEEGEEIQNLLKGKDGLSEVEFLLRIGRWNISGRFDKLILDAKGAYKIVDWKTDHGPDWEKIASHYRDHQMKMYALALYRSGRPALTDGKVRVHLALLRRPGVIILSFTPDELNEFALDLEKELRGMDDFADTSAPLRVAAKR
jgi:ATP-dependent exoDNAse (exonuclease V) beta subunit